MSLALIDTTKGHHVQGRLTVHMQPDRCRTAPWLPDKMSVTRKTAINGVLLGQWYACPDCDDIYEKGFQ